jgi:EmrB/QacA subfamily drug resistance transporter
MAHRSGSRGALVLLATGLGLFMIFLDATIVNVALPDIQSDFDVGEAGIQWVVAAYSLTMGMFMMSAASVADRIGRRRTYVIGIVVFCLASLGCGLAPNITTLNLMRALQGVGAAVVNVASLALVGAAYPDPKAKTRAVGLWTGIAGVGIALGPTVGGVLTETVGWRVIFLVNPVVGGVAIALTLAFVTESRDPTTRGLDPLGQILFIVGIGAVTYALVEGPQDGWTSPTILALLLLSAVVALVFVRTELRVKDPMMDVRVFEDSLYTGAIVTVFATLFAVYGTLLVITQYLQNVRDYSPETAGAVLFAFSFPAMVLAPIAGRLAARYGGRRPTLAGLALACVGTAALGLTTGGPIAVTIMAMAVLGSAAGLAVAPATSMAMASIEPERSGMASGILSSQRALGSTAGFAIMGSVLAATVAATLPGDLEPVISDPATREQVVDQVVEDADPRAVASIIGPKKDLPDGAREQPAAVAAADDAFVTGIRLAEGVAFVVVFSALMLGRVVFPRTEPVERSDELAEDESLDDPP